MIKLKVYEWVDYSYHLSNIDKIPETDVYINKSLISETHIRTSKHGLRDYVWLIMNNGDQYLYDPEKHNNPSIEELTV